MKLLEPVLLDKNGSLFIVPEGSYISYDLNTIFEEIERQIESIDINDNSLLLENEKLAKRFEQKGFAPRKKQEVKSDEEKTGQQSGSKFSQLIDDVLYVPTKMGNKWFAVVKNGQDVYSVPVTMDQVGKLNKAQIVNSQSASKIQNVDIKDLIFNSKYRASFSFNDDQKQELVKQVDSMSSDDINNAKIAMSPEYINDVLYIPLKEKSKSTGKDKWLAVKKNGNNTYIAPIVSDLVGKFEFKGSEQVVDDQKLSDIVNKYASDPNSPELSELLNKLQNPGQLEGSEKPKTFKDLMKQAWELTKSNGASVAKAAALKYGEKYDQVVDKISSGLMSRIPGIKKLPKKWQDRLASAAIMIGTGALTGGIGVAALRGGKMAADFAKTDQPFFRKETDEEKAKSEKKKADKLEKVKEQEKAKEQERAKKAEQVRKTKDPKEIKKSLELARQNSLKYVDDLYKKYGLDKRA